MPLTAIPPSWFLPTLTASSPVGLRACCVPLPTMGFTGFPGSPALASRASLSPPMPHPPELSPPLQPLPCHQGTLPSRRSQVAACATSRPSSTMASVVSAAVANMRHPLLSWASRGFNTLRRPSFEHPKAPSPLISFLLKEVQGRSLGSAHRRRTFVRRRLAEACWLRPQPPVATEDHARSSTPLQMRRHPQWLPMEPRTLPGCTTGRHRPVVDAYGPVHRCPGRPCGRLPFRRSRCCQRLTQPALARLPEDSSPTSTTRRGLAPCVCARIAMRTPPLRLDEAPRPKLRSRSQHSPHPSPAGCRLRCARQTSLPAPRLGLRAKAPPPRPSAEADKPA